MSLRTILKQTSQCDILIASKEAELVNVLWLKPRSAFVEILPGKEGLLHISEIDWGKTEKVEDVLNVGDEVDVKLLEIDEKTGKMRLSRKALIEKPEGYVEPERKPRPQGDRAPRRDDRRQGSDRRNDKGPRRDDRSRGPRRPQQNDVETPSNNDPEMF